MQRKLQTLTTIIAWLFYSLFFLVPLVVSSRTSELFEFNKMWLTYILTILIAAFWGTKMIIGRRFFIRKTPFDIPLLLFLLSQFISTIISWDHHVSLWGYYSRFNGGFLSMLCYVFLYYAFVSNLSIKHVFRTITASLISGLIVALWGFPSHFGNDPTCLLFRGTFDVSCWTDAFKPTIRAFSLLGQPAWLAAYMSLLIPVALALAFANAQSTVHLIKHHTKQITSGMGSIKLFGYAAVSIFFYILLIFSDTKAGFIGFWIGNIVFWGFIFLKRLFSTTNFLRYFLTVNVLFVLCNFFLGWPVPQLAKFSYDGMFHQKAPVAVAVKPPTPQPGAGDISEGGTDSGKIRLFVWHGAIDAWKAYPLFGTGVETFAFAYYKFRPAGHNLTSEWDYLYNKAHNEYLNYLATTGIFGLGTYLAFIGVFLASAVLWLLRIGFGKSEEAAQIPITHKLLTVGLIAGYVTILVSNFFGFSVVIINLYIFLIPAFSLLIMKSVTEENEIKPQKSVVTRVDPYQWTGIVVLFGIGLWMIIVLARFWNADKAYALGSNLDHVGDMQSYQSAYTNLTKAVQLRKSEPVFRDELSYNSAVLAAALAAAKQATEAAGLAQQAVSLSNDLVTTYPQNIVFWKDRVRVFYTLSTADAQFLPTAIDAIQHAHDLAPTDAKVVYNLGVLYGQSGQVYKGLSYLDNAIRLKPDYLDAYLAKALLLRQQALGKNGKVKDTSKEAAAVQAIKQALLIDPANKSLKDKLTEWGAD